MICRSPLGAVHTGKGRFNETISGQFAAFEVGENELPTTFLVGEAAGRVTERCLMADQKLEHQDIKGEGGM